MLSKLLGILRKKPVRIEGTAKLPDGRSKIVAFGDPMSGGVEIVLCRVGGVLYALDRKCPHEPGGYIGEGPLVDAKYARCPLHEYKFDPTDGAPVGAVCAKARTYKVREDATGADVWI
jgi:nitrite reductase/ring-hydroxylating ferredoxin subunit